MLKTRCPMKPNILLLFVLGMTMFSGTNDCTANELENKLNRLIVEADIVVEGTVVNSLDATNRNIQGYVGESETPILFQFGTSQETFFKISKVYLGRPKENQIIRIYAYPDIPQEISELTLDKKYMLFLKRRKVQPGYVIVDFGRGAWRIFDYNGTKKIKRWDQFLTLRNTDSYPNYDEFVSRLNKKLSLLSAKKD